MSENIQKYENWRAITEADHVTMFIKTWFAYIDTLRVMFPECKNDQGDGKHLNAYSDFFKSNFAEKFCTPDNYNKIQNLYIDGWNLVKKDFSDRFFDTFFKINSNFNYSHKIIEPAKKQGYVMGMKINKNINGKRKYKRDLILNTVVKFWKKNANGNNEIILKSNINISQIAKKSVLDTKTAGYFTENAFINRLTSDIFSSLFQDINSQFASYDLTKYKSLVQRFSKKNFALTTSIINQIKSYQTATFAERIGDFIDYEPEKTYITYQYPCNNFTERVFEIEDINFNVAKQLYVKEDNKKIKIDASIWFMKFAYKIRNALFHEIIDPFDTEWQRIFKYAYLILKEIVDINIEHLKFVESIDGKVKYELKQYIQDTILDEFDELATHVYLENVGEIEIIDKKINNGEIFIIANVKIELKLQFGSDGDQRRDDGVIDSEEKNVKIEAKFDFDFNIIDLNVEIMEEDQAR